MLMWTRKNPGGLNSTQRTVDNQEMPRVGEIIFPKEEYTN